MSWGATWLTALLFAANVGFAVYMFSIGVWPVAVFNVFAAALSLKTLIE